MDDLDRRGFVFGSAGAALVGEWPRTIAVWVPAGRHNRNAALPGTSS
jgi:hypothetical protein